MALDNRHELALELLEQGLKQSEIAKRVGISHQTLRHWCHGDSQAGPTAIEFCEAYKVIHKKQDEELSDTIRKTKQNLTNYLLKYSETINKNKKLYMTESVSKVATNMYKVLEDTTEPRTGITNIYNVNIKTTEDALNEFNRFRIIRKPGEATADGGGVSKPTVGRAGKVLASLKSIERMAKTISGGELCTEPETKSLPPKPSSG